MNIVGPRPERPTIFAELREHITEYPLRQRAKPGITGLAQINHHYDRSIEDVRTKVSYDLEYIRRQSLGRISGSCSRPSPPFSSAAAAGNDFTSVGVIFARLGVPPFMMFGPTTSASPLDGDIS